MADSVRDVAQQLRGWAQRKGIDDWTFRELLDRLARIERARVVCASTVETHASLSEDEMRSALMRDAL